jgi:hypothetical protein
VSKTDAAASAACSELIASSVAVTLASLVAQDESRQGARGAAQNRSDSGASAGHPTQQGAAPGTDGTTAQSALLLSRHADTTGHGNCEQDD